MPLDGITAKFLAQELNDSLSQARVEKIHQKNHFDVYLKLRTKGESKLLILSANPSSPRIHITSESFSNPLSPIRFCSILRKYLTGSRIIEITNTDFERIFNIKFQVINELGDISFVSLIVEIMGRHSNIILVNNENTIIDSAVHIDSRTSSVREILPARKYTLPPRQDKLLPEKILDHILSKKFFIDDSQEKIEKYLINNIMGFSPQFAKEICIGANVDSKIPVNELSSKQIDDLHSLLKIYMRKIIDESYSPSIFFTDSSYLLPYDFHAFIFSGAQYYKKSDSISEAMDSFYLYKSNLNDINQKKSYYKKIVSKTLNTIQNKIVAQTDELKECQNAQVYKIYADLILSNLHNIKNKAKSVNVLNYYQDPAEDISIPLNPSKSPSANAQNYYKKYRKLQSRNEYLTKALKKERQQENYLNTLIVSIENADSLEDLDVVREELEISKLISIKQDKISKGQNKLTPKSKIHKKAGPRKFISSEDVEILVGRNNIQNDYLTLKHASKNDLWFHIQKAPGTHVILRCENAEYTDTSVLEAAMLAAWYSKSKQYSGIGIKLNIDYCKIKDVSKPKGSAPGFVIYKNFKTVLVEAVMPENIKIINE